MEILRGAKGITAGEAEIARIQAELSQARADLHNALHEVGAKVTHVEVSFTPEHLIRSYPLTAAGAAGAVGFVLGSILKKHLTAPMAVLALLGFVMARETARRSDPGDPTP